MLIAALSAVVSSIGAGFSFWSIHTTQASNAATQMAAISASVDQAVQVARDSKYSANLLLALRNASQLERSGVISADDAAALADYLRNTKGVRDEDWFCKGWNDWKSAHGAPTPELQKLMDAALNQATCPPPKQGN